MTRFDVIRQMSDDELVDLVVWGSSWSNGIEIPDCSDTCPDFQGGCANDCPHEKREKAVRDYLSQEV